MKSQVNALLHVSEGIIADASSTYPELGKSFCKDLQRLTLLCQHRGLGVYTLDLPSLDAALLNGLENGRLATHGLVSRLVSSRVRVPRLFAGLWLRVFDKDSCLKQDVDVNAIFFLRQLCCVGKKIAVECSPSRIKASKENFNAIESGLRKPSLGWNSDDLICEPTNAHDYERWMDSDCRYLNDSDNRGPDLFPGFIPEGKTTERLKRTYSHREYRLNHLNYLSLTDILEGTRSQDFELFDFEKSGARDGIILNKIQKVSDLISEKLGVFDPVTFSDWLYDNDQGIGFRHGPGAVAERLSPDLKSGFTAWPRKLSNCFSFVQLGLLNLLDGVPSSNERSSRLLCVPKTAKGPRLIAAEPVAHQWCQQVVLKFLFNRVDSLFKGDFIDFRDQGKSHEMVVTSSQDKRLATVDLSDASDRLSCYVVERVFRHNLSLLSALHSCRTRWIEIDNSLQRDYLILKKFASQGTATTFPVMSLVMLCIALGASHDDHEFITWSSILSKAKQVRVFGDDIVIPSTGYEDLVRAMELLQLKVNIAKSYVSGSFRESCGLDAFQGDDITPVKPTTLVPNGPSSVQALVDTSNNLFEKGLWRASERVLSLIPSSYRRNIGVRGIFDDGPACLTSFVGSDTSNLKVRWNQNLQRREVSCINIVDTSTKARGRRSFHLLDFFSKRYSPTNPRIVEYGKRRPETKLRLRWVLDWAVG
ncbi:RNA-directed RNA polymerase [ssRNA phage SRR7976323_6]|uniref:RNA-directed RNA polymerase n=1 Tax=ssRNA phage SRR7976323_6 TaxID=2786693 RepID=A0A8S5L5G9_9VIRU|nr:RNA-directed RNA polymerase [ssRNA phage SRR7976323_6]DAD52732.1 TPA_asm: RNA-directed RNA polymerase [ssRNA phage SRR7976323_6]